MARTAGGFGAASSVQKGGIRVVSDDLGPQVDAVLDEHIPDSAGWLLLVWRDGGLTVLGTATVSGRVPELLADASRACREAAGAPGSLQ